MTTMALEAHSLARRIRDLGPDDRPRRTLCERRLVQLYHEDPNQRQQVISAFEPFAASFALRLKRGEEPLDDLRQVAMMGLIKALERFDPTVGRSFTAYAAPTILGELRRHYRDTGWAVHVPRAKQELAQKLGRATREIEQSGREATDGALAEKLGVPTAEVNEGRLAASALRASSTQRPVESDDPAGNTLEDLRGDVDPGFEAAESRATIAALTRGLSRRDREIVVLRFARQLPQSAIGKQVGISQMQVSRVLRRAVEQLAAAA